MISYVKTSLEIQTLGLGLEVSDPYKKTGMMPIFITNITLSLI